MLNVLAFGLSEEYRSRQLTQMRNLNYDLDKLVNGARQPKTTGIKQSPGKINVAEYYKRVRGHAMVLYSALKEKLETPCVICQVCVDFLLF